MEQFTAMKMILNEYQQLTKDSLESLKKDNFPEYDATFFETSKS